MSGFPWVVSLIENLRVCGYFVDMPRTEVFQRRMVLQCHGSCHLGALCSHPPVKAGLPDLEEFVFD